MTRVSALIEPTMPGGASLPMLHAPDPRRTIAFNAAGRISAAAFAADVHAAAAVLPRCAEAINLCEDRYAFLVAFAACALRGQTSLLPHSRAPDVVAEVMQRHADACCVSDVAPEPRPPRLHRLRWRGAVPGEDAVEPLPELPAAMTVAIGHTSGSTGLPQPQRKTWLAFHACTGRNAAVLAGLTGGGRADVVATVPPQHMFGMELSVLLPLLADVAVHTGRPFFPQDIAQALEQAQAPRLLVTTPVHLRALLDAGVVLPPLAGVVTATAPLPQSLAARAEARFGAPVQEMFGSTETCVIAHRRAASEEQWTLYDGLQLSPQPDRTLVTAPWFAAPVALQDVVELHPGRRFSLCGRSSDLIEIAGKRASLADLTQRLQSLPGVRDGVVFQQDAGGAGGVRRIVALAVAPGEDVADLMAALRRAVDPVFLPRPLKLVPALPRNATGKLVRAELLALLGR